MRLRYKKLILIFTLAIMLIGLGTFSMLAPSVDFSFGSVGEDTADTATGSALAGKSDQDIESEISLLMADYFDAKLRVDMKEMAECVSDVSHVDEKRLVTEAEYIEAYKNLDCTIKPGAEEGAYRVYVYYEVKVYDIDTLIPSLTALYVTVKKDGTFEIYLGTLDSEAQKRMEELDNSKEIKSMVDTVQKRLEEIVSSNEQVREFYQMLESSDEGSDNVNQDAGSTATPTAVPAQ